MSLTVSVSKATAKDGVWVVRDHIRFLAEVPKPGFALLEVTVPPGSGTPPHRHASPEIFHVVDGEITIGSFGAGAPSLVLAGPGDSVSVPSNLAHNYQNSGAGPARMLVVVEDQMVAFFKDLGRTDEPPQGPPTEEEIGVVMSACGRHGIEILPPPRD